MCDKVPVGCVFVKKGNRSSSDTNRSNLKSKVLSSGFNATNLSRNGTRHAELVAIDDILLKQGCCPDVFRGCDLYVTCEVSIQLYFYCLILRHVLQ